MANAPYQLHVVIDEKRRFICAGTFRTQLEEFVKDNPGKDWKVITVQNSNDYRHYKDPVKYPQYANYAEAYLDQMVYKG